jgi:two-component sensor histidine kinase
MQLTWVERGGPPVSRPVSKGFGTRLIERSLAFELDSASSIRFEPDGVVCEIDADLREIVG